MDSTQFYECKKCKQVSIHASQLIMTCPHCGEQNEHSKAIQDLLDDMTSREDYIKARIIGMYDKARGK